MGGPLLRSRLWGRLVVVMVLVFNVRPVTYKKQVSLAILARPQGFIEVQGFSRPKVAVRALYHASVMLFQTKTARQEQATCKCLQNHAAKKTGDTRGACASQLVMISVRLPVRDTRPCLLFFFFSLFALSFLFFLLLYPMQMVMMVMMVMKVLVGL